jgi:hypothetical protein
MVHTEADMLEGMVIGAMVIVVAADGKHFNNSLNKTRYWKSLIGFFLLFSELIALF